MIYTPPVRAVNVNKVKGPPPSKARHTKVQRSTHVLAKVDQEEVSLGSSIQTQLLQRRDICDGPNKQKASLERYPLCPAARHPNQFQLKTSSAERMSCRPVRSIKPYRLRLSA